MTRTKPIATLLSPVRCLTLTACGERPDKPKTEKAAADMTMRIYWPKPEALDGSWKPSPIVRAQ